MTCRETGSCLATEETEERAAAISRNCETQINMGEPIKLTVDPKKDRFETS